MSLFLPLKIFRKFQRLSEMDSYLHRATGYDNKFDVRKLHLFCLVKWRKVNGQKFFHYSP